MHATNFVSNHTHTKECSHKRTRAHIGTHTIHTHMIKERDENSTKLKLIIIKMMFMIMIMTENLMILIMKEH